MYKNYVRAEKAMRGALTSRKGEYGGLVNDGKRNREEGREVSSMDPICANLLYQ